MDKNLNFGQKYKFWPKICKFLTKIWYTSTTKISKIGKIFKTRMEDLQGPPKRPNVIILLADDMGMGDISLNNANGKIKTPNIDKLGKEGINFLDAHSASTKCSPRFGSNSESKFWPKTEIVIKT